MDEIVIKGAIGTGSYGEVYRALVRGKIVAVKKLHVRNLRAEADRLVLPGGVAHVPAQPPEHRGLHRRRDGSPATCAS